MNPPVIPQPYRYRDLTIIDVAEGKNIVIACDSSGAIGPKQNDIIKVPGYILGRFSARVALMEVLAAGAWPVCVVNTLCVEPSPAGEEISQGVADEIRVLGIDPSQVLTGSTEKNIPTTQSGIGITVVGVAHSPELRINRLQKGDSLAVFGIPKVGSEVCLDDPEIADLNLLCTLLKDQGISEIIPVGSGGIIGEVTQLAAIYSLDINWQFPSLDLHKSAGPSTCLLVGGRSDSLLSMGKKSGKPFTFLGSLS